jgi:glutathione synthase
MSLRIAFQMDPIDKINIAEDTTFRLAEEAQKRGHMLFYFLPQDLMFVENEVVCQGSELSVQRKFGDHFALGPIKKLNLINDVDIIWLRQDPPFDMSYITTTHLLDFLVGKTMVVNDPFWVRNYPEKILVLNYPDLIPPTMVGRNMEMFKTFREMHGDTIVKPLYGNGGAGVFKIGKNDPNLSSLIELFQSISHEPIIMQKYLPDVKLGDKRVILVDGLPVGAINRVACPGEIRSNMHVGGKAMRVDLTPRDLEICQRVGVLMRDKGQVLVGLDIIGDMLTEINLTSPTGIQELEKFDNINVAEKIWESLESRYNQGL